MFLWMRLSAVIQEVSKICFCTPKYATRHCVSIMNKEILFLFLKEQKGNQLKSLTKLLIQESWR